MQDRNRFKSCWVQIRRRLGPDWERGWSRLREDGSRQREGGINWTLNGVSQFCLRCIKRILYSCQDMVGGCFNYLRSLLEAFSSIL